VFHENLKRIRSAKGFTQASLAEALGSAVRNVSNWEQGHRDPSLSTIRQIAQLLRVSVAELMEGEPAPARKPRQRK
jgi:transcriptional regulator with XRE-family HTH domain